MNTMLNENVNGFNRKTRKVTIDDESGPYSIPCKPNSSRDLSPNFTKMSFMIWKNVSLVMQPLSLRWHFIRRLSSAGDRIPS